MTTNIKESEVDEIYLFDGVDRWKAEDFEIREEKNFSFMDIIELKFNSDKKENIEMWDENKSRIEIEQNNHTFFLDDLIPGYYYTSDSYHHEVLYLRNLPQK